MKHKYTLNASGEEQESTNERDERHVITDFIEGTYYASIDCTILSNIAKCDKINLGGVNDTDSTTVCGRINLTLNNLYSKIPTARVGIIAPTHGQVLPRPIIIN